MKKTLLNLIGASIIGLSGCDLNTETNPQTNKSALEETLTKENSLIMRILPNFRNTEVKIAIPSSEYFKFKLQTHEIENDSDMLKFVTYNHPLIKQLAENLKDNYPGDPAQTILDFVHSIAVYDLTIETNKEYVKYPIETLVEQNGDCEDLTILAAALMKSIEIDVALVVIPWGIIEGRHVLGHVPLGVVGNYSGAYYSFEGKKYYYAETVGTEKIGRPLLLRIGEDPGDRGRRGAIIMPVK